MYLLYATFPLLSKQYNFVLTEWNTTSEAEANTPLFTAVDYHCWVLRDDLESEVTAGAI